VAEERLGIWEALFRRAMRLLDSVPAIQPNQWTFGGGTVLMLKHGHRFSKDIDIFVPDPQFLAYLTPRLNDTAECLTTDYVEDTKYVKLRFPEGEIDFVASASLTHDAYRVEDVMGRQVQVETSAEIVAKKVWHRGDHFTARDVLDLAMVAEREPDALYSIQPILRDRRDTIMNRVRKSDAELREAFAALEVLNYTRSYDECVARAEAALSR
jgi:predicted nucleotidyltransferase component of viral defense system